MIRSYGAGKFIDKIDSYVYELSLEGWGEEIGDVEEMGHFSKVELGREGLRAIMKSAKEQGDKLTMEEMKLIRKSHGAIVEIDSQGFVTVAYYKSKKRFEKQWRHVESMYGGAD